MSDCSLAVCRVHRYVDAKNIHGPRSPLGTLEGQYLDFPGGPNDKVENGSPYGGEPIEHGFRASYSSSECAALRDVLCFYHKRPA